MTLICDQYVAALRHLCSDFMDMLRRLTSCCITIIIIEFKVACSSVMVHFMPGPLWSRV